MRIKRIEKIEEYIIKKEHVSLDTLCDIFEISKNTLRRDLNEIIKNGNVKKVYGGVASISKKTLTSFEERKDQNEQNKLEIALKASTLIEDGDVIYVDSGTTTANLALGLKDKKITAITNNFYFIEKALHLSNITVVVLPGRMDRSTKSFIGIEAERLLENYNINKAFLTTTGITHNLKVTNASPEESKIKSIAVENSDHTYLLMDDTKFDSAGLMTYTSLSSIDSVIVNAIKDERYQKLFKELNINVYLTQN